MVETLGVVVSGWEDLVLVQAQKLPLLVLARTGQTWRHHCTLTPQGSPILAREGLSLDPPGDHEGVLLEPPNKGPTPHRAALTLQVGAVAPRATV